MVEIHLGSFAIGISVGFLIFVVIGAILALKDK